VLDIIPDAVDLEGSVLRVHPSCDTHDIPLALSDVALVHLTLSDIAPLVHAFPLRQCRLEDS
jgi:hypothetical protein